MLRRRVRELQELLFVVYLYKLVVSLKGQMYHRKFTDVPVVWKPNENSGKIMKKFKKIVEDKYMVKLDGYMDLYKWSTENLCEFWAEMWDFVGIISSKRFDTVLDLNAPMNDLPKWYEGAKLNFAENLLKYRDDKIAIIQD
ncbi:acetoacetyl-CoA synthetase, partial [Nephila pilipes]